MPCNTRAHKRQQVKGGESSRAIRKQQKAPKMAGTNGSQKRQKAMKHKKRCAIGKQEKAPRSPDYTPPGSPDHTPLCMVNGIPVTTVSLSKWGGISSPGKHTCTPKSPDYTPPCSPKYAPARAQQPGSGTRCGTSTYALGPL